ncbi:Rhomboid-related protein 2 [Echinococcus granulosus]|nr:Rhomboid-related protein 2 [Echinococcus granulosus]
MTTDDWSQWNSHTRQRMTEEEPLDQLPITGYDYSVGSLTEEEYRQWIEHTFLHMFQSYDQIGGIPCRELLNRFQYRGYGLPQDRRKDLMLYLDANRDGRITYEQFRAVLVHKRYLDLSPYQRVALCALLAANPGLRLAAARARAIKHLQMLDAIGRGAGDDDKVITSEKLPNAITGYAGNCDDDGNGDGGAMFRLEPDGVWPTSRARLGRRCQPGEALTIMEEEYIPEFYLKVLKCLPPPIFCSVVVLVQLAVFIYYAVELNRRAEAEPANALTWSSGFPYFSPLFFDPRRRREVWRFFTYFLVHQGIWHVIFNSLVTLLLGSLMEWAQGTWRVAVLYFLGVLAGSLATSVWDPRTIGIGASGGAYVLLGAHLALTVVHWEEMKHDFFAVARASTAAKRAMAVAVSGIFRVCLILLLCAVDFGIALYERYGLPDAPLHASYSPIPAGLMTGVLVGVPLLRYFHERPWERIEFWACFGVCFALFIFTIFWNIFWPGYPTQKI